MPAGEMSYKKVAVEADKQKAAQFRVAFFNF
jgi:hypothetical protein